LLNADDIKESIKEEDKVAIEKVANKIDKLMMKYHKFIIMFFEEFIFHK